MGLEKHSKLLWFVNNSVTNPHLIWGKTLTEHGVKQLGYRKTVRNINWLDVERTNFFFRIH